MRSSHVAAWLDASTAPAADVHLDLSTYGFHPHSTDSSPYFCWPVFVMPYNLPPDKYLKQGFIFHAIVVPGPKESKKQMNIFLRPLMEELKEL
jgi:hypothetical protein